MILLEAIAPLFPSYTYTDPTNGKSKTIDLVAELSQLNGNALDDAASEYLSQYLESAKGSPYENQSGEILDISSFKNDLIISILLWGPDGSNIKKNPIIYFLENTVIPRKKIEAIGATAIPAICDAIEENDLPLNLFDIYFIKNDTGLFDEAGNAFKYRFDILKIFLDSNKLKKYQDEDGNIPDINWIYNNDQVKKEISNYPQQVKTVDNRFLSYSDMKLVAQSLFKETNKKESQSLRQVMTARKKIKIEDIEKDLITIFDIATVQKELQNKSNVADYKTYITRTLESKDKNTHTVFLNKIDIEYPYDETEIAKAVEEAILNAGKKEFEIPNVSLKDIIKENGWTEDIAVVELQKLLQTDTTTISNNANKELQKFVKQRLLDSETKKDILNCKFTSNRVEDIIKGLVNYRNNVLANKLQGLEILGMELGIPKKYLNIRHMRDIAVKTCRQAKRDDQKDILDKINKGMMDNTLNKIFKAKYPYNSNTTADNMKEIRHKIFDAINKIASVK